MTELPNLQQPWAEMPADVVTRLQATDTGITADEARKRLDFFGPNELVGAPPTPAWKRFVA